MSNLEIILSLATLVGTTLSAFLAYKRTKHKLVAQTKLMQDVFVTSFMADQEKFRKEVLGNYELLKNDYTKLHTTNVILEEKIKNLQINIDTLKRENIVLENQRNDLQYRVKQLEDDKNRLNNNIILMEIELQKLNGMKK
jgi:septal ring factor EnvC (AmiA/AmiB activator)